MIELKLVPVPGHAEQFELEIKADQEGLEMLEGAMEALRLGRTDHIHFMDEFWGAGDIQSDRSATKHWIPHIRIYKA